MNPPSEQLVRDYLNRMSVAARGKLGFRDRQALLDRIRMQIEMECGGLSSASAAQVRKALAGLGDPVAVVEVEHARIASAGEGLTGAGSGAGPGPGVQQFMDAPVPAGRPAPDGADGADAAAGTGGVAGPSGSGGFVAGSSGSGSVPESSGSGGSVPESSGGRSSVPDPAEGPGHGPDPGGSHRLGRGQPSTPAVSGTGRPSGRGRLAAAAAIGRLWQLADGTVVLARRNLLEAVALVLMGAGGAAFPPVWLLGAGLAMTSKTWDLRDKWTGISGPVLLVTAGAVLALIFGGKHASLGSYAFEAWLSAGRVSRGASVLGAGYLLWRLHRGPREPKQLPWNVPRRHR